MTSSPSSGVTPLAPGPTAPHNDKAMLPRPLAAKTALPRRLALHFDKWKAITRDQDLLKIVRCGLRFELHSPPSVAKRGPTFRGSPEQKKALAEQIEHWLQLGVIEPDDHPRSLISLLFPVPKSDGRLRWVLDSRRLNEHIVKQRFKLEGLSDVRAMLQPEDWLTSLDLTDAYLHVGVSRRHRRFLAFRANDRQYRFAAMSFGTSSAPHTFTRLLRPVMAQLRRQGIRCQIYLDDMILAASSAAQAQHDVNVARRLLTDLGFNINQKKSVTTPTQRLRHLGFVWDTRSFRLSLPREKLAALRKEARRVLRDNNLRRLTVRRLAGLVGKVVAAAPAARALDFRRHSLQRTVQHGLRRSRGNWDSTVSLSRTAMRDAKWLASTALRYVRACPIRPPTPTVTLTTDASPSGYGGVYQRGELQIETFGFFKKHEASRSSNWRESVGISRTFFSFRHRLRRGDVLLVRTDNTTALSTLRRFGSRHRHLGEALDPVIRACLRRGIHLLAEHIPGAHNQHADRLSRLRVERNEWELDDVDFRRLVRRFGRPQVDWFATAANAKCRQYCARHPDPRSTFTDAFRHDWRGVFGLFVPPINLIRRVVTRLADSGAHGLVVVPDWPTRGWFATLVQLARAPPVPLPSQAMRVPHGFPHPMRDKRAPPLVAFLV